MFKVKLFKRKGIAYVIPLVLSVLMAMALAGSLYTIHAQSFKSLTAERIEIQAMNFARQKAKEISIAPYSKTVDGTIVETRAPIDGATDWQREVVLPGVEVDLGSGNKKRDVNVNVYLGSELYPRATQTETLTSQGSGSPGIKVITGVGTGTGYLPIPEGFERSECKFLISFQATGGGDNHHGVVTDDGYVSFLLHTQAYRYIVIGIKAQ